MTFEIKDRIIITFRQLISIQNTINYKIIKQKLGENSHQEAIDLIDQAMKYFEKNEIQTKDSIYFLLKFLIELLLDSKRRKLI